MAEPALIRFRRRAVSVKEMRVSLVQGRSHDAPAMLNPH